MIKLTYRANDEETPEGFVAEVLGVIFGKTAAEARAFVTTINQEGRAVCAVHPAAIADILLAKAHEHIEAAGHPLRITTAALPESTGEPRCAFCLNSAGQERTLLQGKTAHICDDCVQTAASHLSEGDRGAAARRRGPGQAGAPLWRRPRSVGCARR